MEISIKSTDNEFLNLAEVASLLRVSKLSVRNFIDRGLLPRVKLGGRVLIHIDDLLQFLNERHQAIKREKGNVNAEGTGEGIKRRGRPRNEERPYKT